MLQGGRSGRADDGSDAYRRRFDSRPRAAFLSGQALSRERACHPPTGHGRNLRVPNSKFCQKLNIRLNPTYSTLRPMSLCCPGLFILTLQQLLYHKFKYEIQMN